MRYGLVVDSSSDALVGAPQGDTPPAQSLKNTAIRWGLWLLVVGPLVFSLLTDATVCPSARMGFACPGCGLTRAMYAALSGDFALAFRYHPLFFVAGPFHVAALGYASWLLLGPQRAARAQISVWGLRIGKAYVVLAFLMLVLWFSRLFGAFGGPVPVGEAAKGHPHPFVNTGRLAH